MTQPGPPPGWYPDPARRHESRYFNGQWTPYVCTRGVNSIDPLIAGPTPAGTPANMPTAVVAAPVEPARLSLTAPTWLVALGALGVFISVFLTWATATVDYGFGVAGTATAHLTGVGKFFGVLVALGVLALSAPAFVGKAVSRKRVVGLTVVLVLLTVLAGAWTANTGNTLHGESNESPDVGALVCWTAVVLLWVGVVLLWSRRRGPARPQQPYAVR